MKNNVQPSQALWWQRGVVYQIYPRSFMDSNGDGVGDLAGITSQLEYLQWLGVEAIWISPIYPSPMADFGYDVSNYTDIHPMFGTLAEFDALLAKAHGLGLKVILDFVPNHTSDRHPWFIDSRSSRDNPKRDWYLWRDAKPDGSPPNNWPSYFGGSAWTRDEKTEQYYLHLFLPEQPDLNWRNPDAQRAMFDVLRFWLDRSVDGFRIDVVEGLIKDAQFRDEPPNPDYVAGKNEPYEILLSHYRQSQPELHDILRDLRRLLDSYGDRVAIGENSPRHSPRELAVYYGNNDELHLPFNFKSIFLPWQPKVIREHIDTYDQVVSAVHGWPNYVLGNHDHHRVASRIGKEQARVAAMLLLTLRGTPTIYYGEELGMQNVAIPLRREQDPFGKRVPGYGRDPERTPMQWNSTRNAGFSTTEPWLPIAPDYEVVNVAAQRDNPSSMLSLYRKLLAYRKATTALQIGSYRPLDGFPEDCLVYLRELGRQRRLIALNFSGEEKELDLSQVGSGRIALSTNLDCEEAKVNVLRLRGHEGCLLEL